MMPAAVVKEFICVGKGYTAGLTAPASGPGDLSFVQH